MYKPDHFDSWITDFLNDFHDSRMTFGINDISTKFVVRVENEIIAEDENVKDVIWSARKALATRKVKTLASIKDISSEELGKALKTAAEYLDGKEFTMLTLHITNYPHIMKLKPGDWK